MIDEIADTGETLAVVATRALEREARHVWTLSLVSHSWANPKPDYTALTSDALVIFPWDKQIYTDGNWKMHPEIEAAIQAQSGSNKSSQ